MKGKSKSKNVSIIILLTSILILVIWSIMKSNEREEIRKSGIYTIFFIDNVQYSKSLPFISYHFYFHGTKYFGEYTCTSKSLKNNPKMILGQFVLETKESLPICNCSIDNLELKAPENGWELLPKELCK